MTDGEPRGPAPERSRSGRTKALRLAGSMAVIAAVVVVAGVATAVHAGFLGGSRAGSGSARPGSSAPTGGTVPNTWQMVGLPPGFSATGVSCVGAADCWVIGSGAGGDPSASAIWQYSGRAWTSVAIAGVGSGALEGLTCVSADDCWAVGQHITVPQTGDSDAVVKPFIEHDAGAGFSPVTGPTVPGDADGLSEVTCVGADDCWAVGSYAANSENGGDGIIHPLIEHYDGDSWTVVTGTGPLIDHAGLGTVSCFASDECWAGGGTPNGGVIEEFDGSSWSVVSDPQLAPSPGFSASGVGTVVCTGPEDCWGVGSTGYPTVPDQLTQPLIAHYTGSGWTPVSSPYVSGPNGALLTGIACVSADDCWAVGSTQPAAVALPALLGPTPTPSPDPALFSQPLVEHYNGGAWEVVVTPQSGTENMGLGAITCIPSTGDCYAAGLSALWTLSGA